MKTVIENKTINSTEYDVMVRVKWTQQ